MYITCTDWCIIFYHIPFYLYILKFIPVMFFSYEVVQANVIFVCVTDIDSVTEWGRYI